jgi:hypothetical protein
MQGAVSILADLRRAIDRGLGVNRNAPAPASLTDTLDWLNLWQANTDIGSSVASGYDVTPNYPTLQL